MPRIFELDPHVADLIAAGEVVERPASVVKELMENSIDAGAGIITVEINAGGMTFIRVTDNGCGIAPEDAKTAFLRHATSKLRGPEGLEAIGTLGFRGEALAAIAAVSRIELLTRECGPAEGVSLTLDSGTVTDMSPTGCPEGTTIIVRDLFFNTPARLKFMKTDRAEASAISAVVVRCALSRPDVSIRFIRDGKTEYHTPGDSRIDSCIYSLFGREFFAGLLHVMAEDEGVSAEGYVCLPAAARGNRSYQFFFINGRPVRSRTLQAALEQAYVNNLPSGRYPSCALYITTGLSNVDVNVHPTKAEVKFVSDKQIFDCVYYAALSAKSNAECGMRNAELSSVTEREKSNAECRMQNAELSSAMKREGHSEFRIPNSEFEKPHNSQFAIHNSQLGDVTVRETSNAECRMLNAELSSATKREGHSEFQIPNSEFASFRIPNSEFASDTDIRVIGEALKVYIIVEYRGGVWFIDKHAAHERIHFDALRADGYEPMSQSVITPVVCRFGFEDAALLLDNADMLDKLGFSIESFGDDSIAVRRIPAEIDISDTEQVLSEICDELKLGGAAGPARRDNIFRMIACKSAIKAGKSSAAHELEVLASRVMSGEVSQCPHGRPVAFELTKATLDRGFKRI